MNGINHSSLMVAALVAGHQIIVYVLLGLNTFKFVIRKICYFSGFLGGFSLLAVTSVDICSIFKKSSDLWAVDTFHLKTECFCCVLDLYLHVTSISGDWNHKPLKKGVQSDDFFKTLPRHVHNWNMNWKVRSSSQRLLLRFPLSYLANTGSRELLRPG